MHSQNKSFGLIGYPLGHSYSKSHFSGKFEREGLENHSYVNFEIQSIDKVIEIVQSNPNLAGLNVTIPHKQAIISYLDYIDPVAGKIGAVNTVKITRSGNRFLLSGYNTDAVGFINSIRSWHLEGKVKALVFGTGGSSLAITYALAQLKIDYVSVSRTRGQGFLSYSDLTRQLAMDHLLWVNCTPVGMFPDIKSRLSLPYEALTPGHYLFDLVYNPEITEFLKMGTEVGSKTMNGLRMLYEQAEESWKIWNERID